MIRVVDIRQTAIGLIIIGVVIYVVAIVLKEMVVTLWNISPLTCVGFIVSIIVAFCKGRFGLDKGVKNLQILGVIFAGTAISHAATSQLQTVWNNFIAGNLVGAAIMGIVILFLYLKGREIGNTDP